LVGLETEGSGFAFERDAVVRVDEIHAVGPPGVSVLGGIAEFVQDRREFDPQLPHAKTSHVRAIFLVFWASEDNLIFDVVSHLPDITCISFGDVDGQKRDAIFVLLVELIEGGNLPPKRRSSVTAEK
jgi:hypothetical protein